MFELNLALRMAAIKGVLATHGVAQALALLNDGTDYRYTGIYKLRGAGMYAAFMFDRCAEHRAWLRVFPLRTSIWRHVLHQGEFMTNDAMQDTRLSRDDPASFLRSCYGSLLQAEAGRLPVGILIHFDVEQREIEPGEASFLREAAPLFLEHLAQAS
ncbi:hypothetical protein QTI66_28900 [Variovorax sp. J22R133]|uniref:hypothetical protein n=1 Tax=Variovorax brevis TaxID=3053503 RepID=UPI002574D6D7|nr:hypothetical protein [Variovorax sp. J22R133]MDM0116190.1 hypothetical protein [Variovorax sp. J22R133]